MTTLALPGTRERLLDGRPATGCLRSERGIASASVFAMTGAFIAGLALTPYSPIPLPILFSAPVGLLFRPVALVRHAVSVLCRPAIATLLALGLLHALALEDAARLTYVASTAAVAIGMRLATARRAIDQDRIWWTIHAWIVISSALFLLRAYDVPAGESVHAFIFGKPDDVVPISGLTPHLHLFGYQVAAGVPLAAQLLLASRQKKAKCIAAGTLLVVSAALFLSGQRSAVVAAAAGLAVVWWYARTLHKLSAVVVIALVAVTATGLESSKGSSVSAKVRETNDESWRLSLQLRALEVVAENPAGLVLSGKSWDDEAGDLLNTGAAITAHNAYLVHTLNLGWIWGLAAAGLLCATLRRGQRLVRQASAGGTTRVAVVAALAGFVAAALNACFHNASLFTFEPVGTMCFLLLWLPASTEGLHGSASGD